MILPLFLLFIFWPSSNQIYNGLQHAVNLLRTPIGPSTTNYDIVLKHKNISCYDQCYKLQRLRQKIGTVWEYVFTDFGFIRVNNKAYDLIDQNRRIVIQIKNSYRTGSSYASDIYIKF